MQEGQENIKKISLRDVLWVICSKLHVFLGIYACIVITTVALAFLLPPVYQVTGDILVKPFLEPNIKLFAPLPTNIRANPVMPQDVNSEVNILKSPQLLRKVVRQLSLDKPEPPSTWVGWLIQGLGQNLRGILVTLGLSEEVSPEDQAIQYLEKKMDIRPITLSNMIGVSLSGTSPERITKILNTLLEDYIDFHIEIFKVHGAKEFYAMQADLFHQNLKTAEEALEKFKKKYGIIEISAQNVANIELLKTLRENQAMVAAKLKEQRLKVGVQARNLAKTGNVGAFTKELQSNILEELVRTLGPLLVERERITLHFQKSSPKYQTVDRQVQELKTAYQKQIKELLSGAQLDVEGMSDYLKILRKKINEIDEESLLLSRKQVEFERLVREVKQNEKIYLMYLNKTEEARIDEQQDANRVSNVTVTSWAQLPTIPIFPRKVLMLLLATTLGFIMASAGAFFAYYLDHTFKTPQDVARVTHLPIFATIDLVKGRPEQT